MASVCTPSRPGLTGHAGQPGRLRPVQPGRGQHLRDDRVELRPQPAPDRPPLRQPPACSSTADGANSSATSGATAASPASIRCRE